MRISWGCVTILSHESTNVRMVLDGFGVILDGLKLLVAAQFTSLSFSSPKMTRAHTFMNHVHSYNYCYISSKYSISIYCI